MAESDSPASSPPEGLIVHLQGHVLLFDQKPAPPYEASAGLRLLFVAVVLEATEVVDADTRYSFGGSRTLDRREILAQAAFRNLSVRQAGFTAGTAQVNGSTASEPPEPESTAPPSNYQSRAERLGRNQGQKTLACRRSRGLACKN